MSDKTQLNITIVQPNIIWENKQANFFKIEQLLIAHQSKMELVFLPEMFSTGFSMQPQQLAETMDGKSVLWMKTIAAKHRCVLVGSLIIEEDNKYFNRLLWVQPDGKIGHYDKRHLFAYAGEDEHYHSGDKRMIASVKGWKINLVICYDLRFPVWLRNKNEAYDVLVVVANWPSKRSLAWKTLLQARAIENQAFVVGVNRVGTDANQHVYVGESSAFDPLGAAIFQLDDQEQIKTITLDKKLLTDIREQLPFLDDADDFVII